MKTLVNNNDVPFFHCDLKLCVKKLPSTSNKYMKTLKKENHFNFNNIGKSNVNRMENIISCKH